MKLTGLFWRVFAWYLGTTVVILGLGVLVTTLTDPEFSFKRTVSVSQDSMRSQGEKAAVAWTKGGRAAVESESGGFGRSRLLFDASGRELTGANVPAHLGDLVQRALKSHDIEIEIVPPNTYAAIQVSAAGKDFVLARMLASSRDYHLVPHPLPLWVRLSLGLFTASLICVFFAQYVTSPLQRLRSATREFASGNLQVRIGSAKPFNRGDEFSDLARDFDNMAAQIQNLVITQQRMMGDISHELRSPLARLTLALEIARRKAGAGAEGALDRIEQEAEKLNTLIGQVLRAARTELSPDSKKLFDLSNLVRDVTGDAAFEASGKDRRVVIQNNEHALVCGDRDLLRSAIENVLRNAIRYTPDKTEVTLDVRKSEENLATVTIRDHGPGVPEQSLPLLFEPFYRVNDARDRESGGAGLGLAITRHIVSAHGGSVRANNRESGGFEVQIDLPLTMPEAVGRSSIRFRVA